MYVAMVVRLPSYRNGEHNSHLGFLGHFKKYLVSIWSYAPLFILKWMVKLSVLFKPLRICLELVLLILKEIGIRIYLWWNVLTTIATIRPYSWILMKTFKGLVRLHMSWGYLVNLFRFIHFSMFPCLRVYQWFRVYSSYCCEK